MQPLHHHYPMLDAFSLSVVSCIVNSVPKFKQVSTIHVSVITYSSIIMIIACTATTSLLYLVLEFGSGWYTGNILLW